MKHWLEIVFCILIGYALGNLSPSYLLGRRKGYDVREDGSGNAGATNTFILLGAKAFVLTTVLDILKAFAAYTVCRHLFPALSIAGALGGTSCVVGHMYPALLGFRGGKGLASLGGVVLGWDWRWFLLLLAFGICIAFLTRYVSLVAPTGLSCLPGVPLLADRTSCRVAHPALRRGADLRQASGKLCPHPGGNGNADQLHPEQGSGAQTHRKVERNHAGPTEKTRKVSHAPSQGRVSFASRRNCFCAFYTN